MAILLFCGLEIDGKVLIDNVAETTLTLKMTPTCSISNRVMWCRKMQQVLITLPGMKLGFGLMELLLVQKLK